MLLLSVEKIKENPLQPRKFFDQASIEELAMSINTNGLLQPILVEDCADGTYILVSGERRLRAVKYLGLRTISAIIRERSNHGGRELLVSAIVENVQRENMNQIDTARAYQRLHDEFHMTWIEISLMVGKNHSIILNLVTLLKLDPEIIEMIQMDQLSHQNELARALLKIPDREARIKLARKISLTGMTVKNAVMVAGRVAEMYGSKLELEGAKSPAMRLAQRRYPGLTEKTAPRGWSALQQVGKALPWEYLAGTITLTCDACSLSEMANESTCRECPLVEFLGKLVTHV